MTFLEITDRSLVAVENTDLSPKQKQILRCELAAIKGLLTIDVIRKGRHFSTSKLELLFTDLTHRCSSNVDTEYFAKVRDCADAILDSLLITQ